HYRFNHHLTTPFWQQCQRETDLAGAEEIVEYYQRFGPSALWSSVMVDPLDAFGIAGYLTILVGQKVPYDQSYQPAPKEQEIWQAMRRKNREVARNAMTVSESLQALHGAISGHDTRSWHRAV